MSNTSLSYKILGAIITTAIAVSLFPLIKHAVRQIDSHTTYDVVIVGGGMSGLSAAHALKGMRTMILEKSDQLGGRVLTHEKKGIPYELGATCRFAGNGPTRPNQNYIVESGKIGVAYQGKTITCRTVTGCLRRMGLTPQELAQIMSFKETQCREGLFDSYAFSEASYKALNALFRLIYPGDISAYACARQKDLFERWPIEYDPQGNRSVIRSIAKQTSSKIKLNAKVLSVEDTGSDVITTYEEDGEIKKAVSKTAIVTTPAPVAQKIIRRIAPAAKSFLDAVKYGRFTVAVIALKGSDIGSFSYLFTPEQASNAIFAAHLKEHNATVFYIYYGDHESAKLQSVSDQGVIEETIDILRRLHIKDITTEDILFTDLKRWDFGATIISEAMLKASQERNYNRPSERVFLAGDYVSCEEDFPYGMAPAAASGETAAANAITFLSKQH